MMRFRFAVTRGPCNVCGDKQEAVFLGIRAPIKRRIYVCADCLLKLVEKAEKDAKDSESNEVCEVQTAPVQKKKRAPGKRRKQSSGSATQGNKSNKL